jgi:predicted nucleic acid-binding Zn ribbon protein
MTKFPKTLAALGINPGGPRPRRKRPEWRFPRTVAAIRKAGTGTWTSDDQWAIGDAINAEWPSPPPRKDWHVLYAIRQALERYKIQKETGHLAAIARTARKFPPEQRRPNISFRAHMEAREPDALKMIVEYAADKFPVTRDAVAMILNPPGYEGYRLKWAAGRNATVVAKMLTRPEMRAKIGLDDQIPNRVQHNKIACAVCQQKFIPKRADAKTCSNRCRQRLFRRQHRAKSVGRRH